METLRGGYVPKNSYAEANRPFEEVVNMPEMLQVRFTGRRNQLVLLNAFDVMRKDPDCKLDVFL